MFKAPRQSSTRGGHIIPREERSRLVPNSLPQLAPFPARPQQPTAAHSCPQLPPPLAQTRTNAHGTRTACE